MATLQKPVMICANGVDHKQFGGKLISAELLSRCFSRMAVWVRLAAKSIMAEFPAWEVQPSQLFASLFARFTQLISTIFY